MKKIYLALSAIVAVFCLSSMTAHAQTQPLNVVQAYDKYVTGPDTNGMYTITLETHATGTTVKKESTVIPPMDIVILIDVSKAMHTNQQDAVLKIVIPSFISNFTPPTDPTKSHNISIIYFDDVVRTIMRNVTSADQSAIVTEIEKYNNNKAGSKPDYAFAAAIEEVQLFKNSGSTNQSSVIYFSATNRKENNNLEWRPEHCMRAVNLSFILKQSGNLDETKSVKLDNNQTLTFTQGLGAKVFSIAEIKQAPEEENQVRHFMNFVSSLYPDKWMTNTSDFTSTTVGTEYPPTDPKYHQFAGNPNDIAGMFETVQEEIKKPAIPINETSVVRDILTPDFKLPDGISDSNIKNYVKVYTRECIYSGSPNYSFYFDTNRNDITNYVSVSLGNDRTINVSGYDFAAHYCGYDEKNGVKTPHAGGQRLVITIPIEPVADYQGGYNLPTNTEDSGIYTEDGEMIEKYPVPDLDFPSIGIIKYGLKQGESSTFTVQKVTDSTGSTPVAGATPFNIILSGTGSTTVPVYAILKDLPSGYYKVTETNWSWTYNVSGNSSITKALPMSASKDEDPTEAWPDGILEKAKCVLFTFTNAKNDGVDQSIYAESVAKNKFKGESTSAGSETVNSKTQPGASN